MESKLFINIRFKAIIIIGLVILFSTVNPIWQTWWFGIAAVTTILALGFGWHKRRIGNIETQKKKLEIQVAEKRKKLRLILEGTASVTGDDFFRLLVSSLGSLLGARYAFIAELTELENRVRTLAFWSAAGLLDNVEYNLTGTPCEKVLAGEMCHYLKDVQTLFPDDKDLVDLGAEGYLAIPLINLSGRVLGHLAVLDDKPMPVESQDLSIFKTFAARGAAELERKQAVKALKYRGDIEFIISTISTSFINLESAEVDSAINHALLTLGAFAGVDRCYIFLFSESGKTFLNTHEWCAKGIEPSFAPNRDLPIEDFPQVMEKLNQFENFYVPRIADLPPDASVLKEILQQQGVQSFIDVPMIYGKHLVGFLGFDSVKAEREWSVEDIRLLRLVGEIFVNALERRRAEKELQKTQAKLIQSEKMAALGKLTAGIAHELNTPVGALQSTMDTMNRCGVKIDQILENSNTLAELKNNNVYRKSLKILKENRQVATSAAERIMKVVISLRNFTRLDEAEFEKADIHEGLDSTLTLIQHEITNRVQIEKNYGDLPKIRHYPAELNQVLMTLLRNAAQAIEKKGVIIIETTSDGNNVYVKISDTGKGISPEKIKTLFELGFTTKDTRVGMGMGLINAYNIIQKHDGELKVESEVGKGTEFLITLPIN